MQPFAPGTALTVQDVADLIDHALLKPELTPQEVEEATRTLAAQRVWSVCVRPSDVTLALATIGEVESSPTRVCTVLGFPHGTTTTSTKVAEAHQALADGATELDMVLNVGRLRGGDLTAVRDDIAAVVEVGHAAGALVKVIFETALLDERQKIDACRASADAGADFTKTSTGFAGGGATLPDVRLMRAHTPGTMQVKASGGVRDVPTLLAMLAEGVTRIGTSSTQALLDGASTAAAAGTLVVPEPGGDTAIPAGTGY